MSRATYDIGSRTIVLSKIKFLERGYDPSVGDRGGAGRDASIDGRWRQ